MTDRTPYLSRIRSLSLAALAILLMGQSSAIAEEKVRDVAATVRVGRTGGNFVRAAAEAYMTQQPETLISVLIANSNRALKAVVERTADIGIVGTTEMPPALRRDMQLRKENVVLKPFGTEAIAIVVHPSNPIQDISLDKLQDAITGEISNWKELGGKDAPITLYLPPPTDTLVDYIHNSILSPGEHLTPRQNAVAINIIDDKVVADPTGIGIIPLVFVSKDAKILTIGGHAPSVENMQKKAYPLTRTLVVAYLDGAAHTVTDFAKFLLEPKGGQKYLSSIKAAPLE